MLKRIALTIVLLLSVEGLCSESSAQCGSIDRGSPDAVRQEVNRIFEKSLDAMDLTAPSGVRSTTWVPPAESDQAQIKCLGTAAVASITELLSSTRSFGQLLAVRMLGWIGGSEIGPPLRRFLASSDSQTCKVAALEALYRAPSQEALPIIVRASKVDPNPYVREKAAQIIARYDPEMIKSSRPPDH